MNRMQEISTQWTDAERVQVARRLSLSACVMIQAKGAAALPAVYDHCRMVDLVLSKNAAFLEMSREQIIEACEVPE